MSEEQLHSLITISAWFMGGGILYAIVNLGLMIWLIVKVNGLAKGSDKFFGWYDNRPCAVHVEKFRKIEQKQENHEERIRNLERGES